ncbi:MAG TPA: universal stress protein [Syntrophomonadaceae bacterium]|nr:universal stress protein [Syntrophomonadaceae bacterium]
MYEKVLVAVDGSEQSFKAVTTAGNLAETGAAKEITLIYVINLLGSGIMADGLTIDYSPAQYQNLLIESAQKMVRQARDLIKSEIKVKTVVESGSPADTILDVAEKQKYDLIVIGNRGLNQVQRLFLGSVSNKVINLAPCSVLVVK